MTNTEMWLDETMSHIKSIKSDIWMLHEIMSLPNCNDCKNKDCEYKPKWGEHIRYNCPLHLAEADRKTENSSEKPNNCEELNAYRKCVESRSFWDNKHCDGCYFDERCPFDEPKDEPTISKMEQVDEPQNGYQTFSGTSVYVSRFEEEPQTDNGIGCSRCVGRFDCYDRDMPHAVRCNNYGKITDEPQTDCPWK